MAATKPTYLFRNCDTYLLNDLLGIESIQPAIPQLKEWMTKAKIDTPIPAHNAAAIEKLRMRLHADGESMKENELLTKFVIPLFFHFDFFGKRYDNFQERQIKFEFDNFILKGNPDWMLCSGKTKPDVPFLLMHEYKSSPTPEVSTTGQLLAAMCTAQANNKKRGEPYASFPTFGIMIVQKEWNFGVLCDKEYSFTRKYDASTGEDLQIIYNMLQYAADLAKEKFEEIADL